MNFDRNQKVIDFLETYNYGQFSKATEIIEKFGEVSLQDIFDMDKNRFMSIQWKAPVQALAVYNAIMRWEMDFI